MSEKEGAFQISEPTKGVSSKAELISQIKKIKINDMMQTEFQNIFSLEKIPDNILEYPTFIKTLSNRLSEGSNLVPFKFKQILETGYAISTTVNQTLNYLIYIAIKEVFSKTTLKIYGKTAYPSGYGGMRILRKRYYQTSILDAMDYFNSKGYDGIDSIIGYVDDRMNPNLSTLNKEKIVAYFFIMFRDKSLASYLYHTFSLKDFSQIDLKKIDTDKMLDYLIVRQQKQQVVGSQFLSLNQKDRSNRFDKSKCCNNHPKNKYKKRKRSRYTQNPNKNSCSLSELY